MSTANPWTKKERAEIYESCKSGQGSFDVGNLRWEATVRGLEKQVAEATELRDVISHCSDLAEQALGKSSEQAVREILSRVSSSLKKLASKMERDQ